MINEVENFYTSTRGILMYFNTYFEIDKVGFKKLRMGFIRGILLRVHT